VFARMTAANVLASAVMDAEGIAETEHEDLESDALNSLDESKGSGSGLGDMPIEVSGPLEGSCPGRECGRLSPSHMSKCPVQGPSRKDRVATRPQGHKHGPLLTPRSCNSSTCWPTTPAYPRHRGTCTTR
jgi:hypothetical protein